MSTNLPPIVAEYARELGTGIDVAHEHFRLYYGSDEDLIRAAIYSSRRTRREMALLQDLTPAVAYDNEVLRALDDLRSPVRVGELTRVLSERWPAPAPHLTRSMWSGQRIARACKRLRDGGLLRAVPVQVGAGVTQIALAYSLTDGGAKRARELHPTDPRPTEWR
ncbi:MAG: hypothetical protein M3320_10255 [Actinomycetota bacterium]|nr:hypothetical protein [Actinomycetota bacterium]MDQ5809047.1 hypothetical protein [Actinomycetota bacterium]